MLTPRTHPYYRVLYQGQCFIARHEACVLVPYPDGKNEDTGEIKYSQGYGRSGFAADSPATTFETAWEWFKEDLDSREKTVNNWLKIEVEQHQFAPLVSAYYQSGSKVGEVVKLINRGQPGDAMALLQTFNRNKGEFSIGLNERRAQEIRLFLKGDYGAKAKPARKLKLWTGDPRKTDFIEVPFPLEEAA